MGSNLGHTFVNSKAAKLWEREFFTDLNKSFQIILSHLIMH